MTYKVEKDWITAASFRAVVIYTDSHRCGYVAVTPEHPLFGVNYRDTSNAVAFPAEEHIGKRGILALVCANAESPRLDVIFDVHGSLTYSGDAGYPVPGDNLWWFGYDCGHYGDGKSPEYLQKVKELYPDSPFMWGDYGVYRSLDYCTGECESLAQQLIDRIVV